MKTLISYIGPKNDYEHLFEMERNAFHFTHLIKPRLVEFRVQSVAWYAGLKGKSYVIWPVVLRGHLVLVILHLRRRGRWTNIDHILIADPIDRAEYRQFVFERLAQMFSAETGFRIQTTKPVNFWHPVQGPDWSCGFRVYDMIRTFISRINEACIRSWEVDTQMMDVAAEDAGDSALDTDPMSVDSDSIRSDASGQPDYPDPRDGYVGTLWDDLSGDFQWGKVRAEMIGIVATECMRLGNYATRIFLAPVNEIRNCTPNDGRGAMLKYGQEAFSLAPVSRDLEPIQRPPMGRSELRWQELRRQRIFGDWMAAGSHEFTNGHRR